MRVLAHIHTFNDADIIDKTIEAVLRQTQPVDGILVVDNASSDGTLDQPSLKHATVLRLPENTGTSGAVHVGMQFALDHDYDWIWVFDADSVPEPDALVAAASDVALNGRFIFFPAANRNRVRSKPASATGS